MLQKVKFEICINRVYRVKNLSEIDIKSIGA